MGEWDGEGGGWVRSANLSMGLADLGGVSIFVTLATVAESRLILLTVEIIRMDVRQRDAHEYDYERIYLAGCGCRNDLGGLHR